MKTILVVCTANICRSPMVAALLRRELETAGVEDQVRVVSAGTRALEDEPASDLAVAEMKRRGLDLREHRSQPLTPDLIREADLILVMEEQHRRSIFSVAPLQLFKVYLLSELSGGYGEVGDPFGEGERDYQRSAAQIEALVHAGMPRILRTLELASPVRD